MKKSTAIEILRRYSDYSIVTVGRPDIPEAVRAKGLPFFDGVNLVYLWSLDREELPFTEPESMEHPVRVYFSLTSLADFLEDQEKGNEISPWSQKGRLGGDITCMIKLLPPDLSRVMYLLSSSAIEWYIKWTQEDDAGDLEALGCGRLYADMNDWGPTRIAFDPDTLLLKWDCTASAECLRKSVNGGSWMQCLCPKERDDIIDRVIDKCPYTVDPCHGQGDLDWDSSGMGKAALSCFMIRDLSVSPSSLFGLLLYCAVSSNHEARRFDEHECPGYDTAVQRDVWNILTTNGISGNAAYRLIESASEYGMDCYWDGTNPNGKRAAICTAFVTQR